MSRLMKLLLVLAWLLSQVMVVSHSQAHSIMDHHHNSNNVAQTVSDEDVHVSNHAVAQHSHGDAITSSDDGVPVTSHGAVDECCDTACQSAAVLSSSETATPRETSSAFKVAVRSASCWSPGSMNPPPNPAA